MKISPTFLILTWIQTTDRVNETVQAKKALIIQKYDRQHQKQVFTAWLESYGSTYIEAHARTSIEGSARDILEMLILNALDDVDWEAIASNILAD